MRLHVVAVEDAMQSILSTDRTKCHPVLIPRDSKLKRIVGTLAHIAMLGVGVAVERASGIMLWPSHFSEPAEMCARCKHVPNVNGCMNVGDMYQGVPVQHDHNL